ncbi:hypothetical protein PSKAS_05740 [Peribacillus sp. N1]
MYMGILFTDYHARSEIHVARLHKDAMIEIEAYTKEKNTSD